MGVTIETAADAFKQIAQIDYDSFKADEGTNLCRRIDELESDVYYLNNENHRIDKLESNVNYLNNQTNKIACNSSNIVLVRNELAELKNTVCQLRSEMSALAVKPKRNQHLEIFDRIFDNSNYPFLENNIFPEIDFNIKI